MKAKNMAIFLLQNICKIRLWKYIILASLLILFTKCSRNQPKPADDIRGKWKIVNCIGMWHTYPKMDLVEMYDSCIVGSVLITDSSFSILSEHPFYTPSVINNFKYKLKGFETIEEDSINFQWEFCYFIFRDNNIRKVKIYNAPWPQPTRFDYDSIDMYSINRDKLILWSWDELIILKRYHGDTIPPIEPYDDRPW